MYTIIFFIIIWAVLLIFFSSISNRYDDKEKSVLLQKARNKKLDKLIFDNFGLKRKGFGPWWLFTKESDFNYKNRAIKHFNKTYELFEDKRPDWL